MKKIIILLSVAIAALAVSCNKVTPQESTPDATKGEKITITASLTDALTKVSLTQDASDADGDIKLSWENGDVITVIDADYPTNSAVFEVASIQTDNPCIATFTGTAPAGATSFNIVYGAQSVEKAKLYNSFFYQDGNASTGHLQYIALLEGVNSIENIEFSKAWAEANGGGNFSQNGALRLRLQLPTEISSVSSVCLTAPEYVFGGDDFVEIDFTNYATPANSIITAYAMLPLGPDIEVQAGVFKVVVTTADGDSYERTFTTTSPIIFKPGKTNAIKLNRSGYTYRAGFAGGTGVEGDPYLIATPAHMLKMHEVLEDNETIFFTLANDIDMDGIEWAPLNNSGKYLKGINFDGDNHTIYNLTENNNEDYPSFVGVLNGTIKNVIFDGAAITAAESKKAGVVAGYIGTSGITGACSRITVQNSSVEGSNYLGGFAGQVANVDGTIDDCHVLNTTVTQNSTSVMISTGGFVGHVTTDATFNNCSAEATISYTGVSGKAGVGGFVGRVESVNPSFTNCMVLQETSVESSGNWTGGFVGFSNGGGEYEGCTSYASVLCSSGQYAGGFVGYDISGKYTDCSASGNVTAPQYVGGFAGNTEGGEFTGCCYEGGAVTGTITSGNVFVGGFSGYLSKAGVKFTNCHVSDASVTGTRPRVGGFVGQNAANGQSEQSTTTNCYVKNTTVKGSTNTGGFVGVQYSSIAKSWVEGGTVIAGGNNAAGFSAFLSNNIKIDNCYSTATVSGGIYSPVGGLVGITYSGSSITNSYASCGVTGTGSYVGGLVGNLVSGVSAINCISWNSDLPLAGASDGTLTNCYTKDATETGTVSSHAQELGWDTSIWDFTGDFPTLK